MIMDTIPRTEVNLPIVADLAQPDRATITNKDIIPTKKASVPKIRGSMSTCEAMGYGNPGVVSIKILVIEKIVTKKEAVEMAAARNMG